MDSPVAFLKIECENIEHLLDDSLRYSYGHFKSEEFYKECCSRLGLLKKYVNELNADDLKRRQHLAYKLSNLSALISRIQRSKLGEFSWPFAKALQELGTKLCQEAPFGGLESNPIFPISAEGGLYSYKIFNEQADSDPIANKKIFNIVFPTSLKDQVLLHPILAHEIGHAMFSITVKKKSLIDTVRSPLVENSIFASVSDFSDWVKAVSGGKVLPNFDDSYDSWLEEYICDLIGLVLFGPSFIAAHRVLLTSLKPLGTDLEEDHPPTLSRYCLLDQAVEILGWKQSIKLSGSKKGLLTDFWTGIEALSEPVPPALKFFDDQQVREALSGLNSLFDQSESVQYDMPDSSKFSSLIDDLDNSVPPSISSISKKGEPMNESIDFRSIIFAGWITWYGANTGKLADHSFLNINRLCNLSILQQEAINIWANK
ncbi:hypothetical protein ACFL48_03350 [Pseudomonadota bacterium]